MSENEKLVKENEMLRHKIMQMKSIGCHKCKDRDWESQEMTLLIQKYK